MTPYYEDQHSKIFLGNCLDVMPCLESVDLVLTDPPYGINRSGQKATDCKDKRHNRKQHDDRGWDSERPNKEVFDLMFQKSKNQIIWGGNYFTQHLPPSMGWIVWDKGQDFSTSDCELAFTSYQKALRRITLNRGVIASEGALHPTQKPLAVIKFCLRYASEARFILDPFCGSGTTLVAAKDLGLHAIGIEISEAYCEVAAKRLAQDVLPFSSLDESPSDGSRVQPLSLFAD